MRITDGQFYLSGCNEYSFKFTLDDSGSIIYGAPTATSATCNNDNDKVFLYALLASQSIAVNEKTIVFYNFNKAEVCRAVNF